MKRYPKLILLALLVIIPLAFSGCDFVMGLFDPLIGNWAGGLSSLDKPGGGDYATGTFALHADETFEFTMQMVAGGSPLTGSGTYAAETAMKTITFTFTSLSAAMGPVVGTPYAMSYELTSSDAVLTLDSVDQNTHWVLEKQ